MAKTKGLSWFVTDRLGFRKTRLTPTELRSVPQGLDTVLRTLRRRLDDRVAEVFQVACMSGELEAAEKLLEVLEDLHERRRRDHGRERREINEELIQRARGELQRRRMNEVANAE